MTLNEQTAQGIKTVADISTGVTVAEVNDSNALLVTGITIFLRVLGEWLINKITKRKKSDI